MMQTRNLKQLPAGQHNGIVQGSEIVDRIFDPAKGPESRLAVTIQPKNPTDGVYPTVELLFNPSEVNPLSNLGKMLVRLGRAPTWGQPWDEASLIGTEVSCTVEYPKNSNFPRIDHTTVQPAVRSK